MKSVDWTLCLIADIDAAGGKDLPDIIRAGIAGGVTLVQLRAKRQSTRAFSDQAKHIARLLKPQGIPFIINDRIDIALACGADGVHLGREDLSLPDARRIFGSAGIIGISVNTVEEARTAEKGGADYLGVGPIFPTSSKSRLRPLLGIEGLRRIRKQVRLPLLAIGGISSENVVPVRRAGADGVAVISALMTAPDITDAASRLAVGSEGT